MNLFSFKLTKLDEKLGQVIAEHKRPAVIVLYPFEILFLLEKLFNNTTN
jgi:hypothetical protein